MAHDQELVDKLKKFSNVRNEPTNYVHEPPKGHPILDLPTTAKLYELEDPTKQTDLLAPYERRHVIPIATLVAPIFDTIPIPDDVYRMVPPYAQNNLFCIFSRSGIRRQGAYLTWDAVVILVQKLCVVRVNCSLDPNNDRFNINRMLLWSRQHQDYKLVEDPETGSIDLSVLPYILDRYVKVEKILQPK